MSFITFCWCVAGFLKIRPPLHPPTDPHGRETLQVPPLLIRSLPEGHDNPAHAHARAVRPLGLVPRPRPRWPHGRRRALAHARVSGRPGTPAVRLSPGLGRSGGHHEEAPEAAAQGRSLPHLPLRRGRGGASPLLPHRGSHCAERAVSFNSKRSTGEFPWTPAAAWMTPNFSLEKFLLHFFQNFPVSNLFVMYH